MIKIGNIIKDKHGERCKVIDIFNFRDHASYEVEAIKTGARRIISVDQLNSGNFKALIKASYKYNLGDTITSIYSQRAKIIGRSPSSFTLYCLDNGMTQEVNFSAFYSKKFRIGLAPKQRARGVDIVKKETLKADKHFITGRTYIYHDKTEFHVVSVDRAKIKIKYYSKTQKKNLTRTFYKHELRTKRARLA